MLNFFRQRRLSPANPPATAVSPSVQGLVQARRRSYRRRRGAAVTEFAIVAPVFLLMVVGFIEFGRALMVQQVLINASRVGVRTAITTGATSGQVQSVVQSYTSGVSINGVAVTVSPDPATAAPGATITVNTSVPFGSVSWMKSAWFLAGKTLKASSQMRKEGFD